MSEPEVTVARNQTQKGAILFWATSDRMIINHYTIQEKSKDVWDKQTVKKSHTTDYTIQVRLSTESGPRLGHNHVRPSMTAAII